MKNYDLIIVLGSQPDIKTWKFPDQIYQCLDKTAELFMTGVAPYIVTGGAHSIALDNKAIRSPFKECDGLADYLIKAGVPSSRILREDESRDTISNLYFLKTRFLVPKKSHKLLFVVADFRVPRLEFLCRRVLGQDYEIDFEMIAAEQGSSYNEPNTFKVQREFLKPMKDGDHAWLKDKFYNAPMYQYWTKHDKAGDIPA